MADTMIDTVLPRELRLGVPPKMPQARTYLFRQQSSLPSYTYGQTITINVPRLQRSYLRKDSYLRFRLNGYFTTLDSTQSLVFDTAGAWGLFEKLEVFDYLGSTVLESISGRPQLMSLLLDMGLKEVMDKNIGSAAMGLESEYTVNGEPPFAGSTGTTNNVTVLTSSISQAGGVHPPNSGMTLVAQTALLPTPATTGGTCTSASPGVLTVTAGTYAAGQQVYISAITNGTPLAVGYYYIAATPTPTATSFALALTPGGTAINTSATGSGINITYFGTTGKTNFSREFSIPMLSFLGMLSKKMVPLHNGFTIVLTVANQKVPMYLSQPIEPFVQVTASGTVGAAPVGITKSTFTSTEPTPPEWNVSDVYLECQILELGPVAESMILSSTQGSPLVVHTKAFRNYVSTIKGASWTGSTLNSTGQQEFVLNMNLNVASLTNILWIMRPTAHTNSLLYASVGARTRNMLQRWQFQYGSTTLPQNNGIQCMAQTAPTYPTGSATELNTQKYISYLAGFTECFQELIKARPMNLPQNRFFLDGYPIDAIFNTNSDNTASDPITVLNWKNFFPSARSWQSLPRFAAGLNLQLVNDKDGDMISGLNTNGMNTSIRGLFHPLYTNMMNNVTVDAFAEYDAFINISPGIATTVSF